MQSSWSHYRNSQERGGVKQVLVSAKLAISNSFISRKGELRLDELGWKKNNFDIQQDHQRRSPGRKSVVPRFSFDLTAVKEASLEEQEEDDDLGMEKEPIEKIEEEEITEEAVVDEETQSVQEEVFEDCVSLLSNHPSPNPTPRPSIVVKDESGANCRVLLEPRTNVPRRQSTIKLRQVVQIEYQSRKPLMASFRFAQGNRSFRRLFRSMSTTKSPRPSLKVTTTDCQLETPVIGATTSPSDHLSPNAEAKSPSPSDRSGMR